MFLVLAISLVSIAVTTALAFNLTDSILKTNVEQTLSDVAEERGSTISSIVQQRVDSVELFATNSVISEILFNTYPGIDDFTIADHMKDELESIENQVRIFQQDDFSAGIKDLIIYNRLGIPVFSIGGDASNEKPLSAPERELRKTNVKFIQDDSKERLLRISVPIMTETLAKPIGKIAVTTHTSVLDNVLLSRFGLETGEVYLVNKDKVMISESIFIENAEFRQKVESEPVILCFEQGRSVSGMTYADYRGVDIFGISHCERDLGFVLLTEVDEDVVLKPIYELQEKIILIGGSIMAIASVTTLVLSRRISNPILKLRNAANEISKGNFDVRTKVETNDEIGQLSSSFDSMAGTIQETVSAITKRENIIKQQEHILLKYSEEKKECCVCLVDIVGSILIKDKLSEEQSKKYYDKFIEHVSIIIKKHGGISVKVVDDSLLFYFPIDSSEVTCKDAIACCLEIVESNSELNENLKSEGLPGMAYKISSTAGSVNVTKSSSSVLQDIFGEPVNNCFKINQYALPNTLVADDSLYERAKDTDKFKFTKIDQSLVKELGHLVFIVSAK